jgi:hypothetical protein
MKLSGWVRLWIVASLIIWIGGFFWLQSISLPYPGESKVSEQYPLKMPPLQPDFSECPRWETVQEGVPTCRDQLRENWSFVWGRWSEQAIAAGSLPLVVFGPFILGALMLGVSWVIRGFRPQPANIAADANKPPPIGPSPSDGG